MHKDKRMKLMACALAAALAAAPVSGAIAAPVTVAGSMALSAVNPEAVASFYRDRLGFRLIADRNAVQGRHIVLERNGMLLEVEESDPRPPSADVETTGSVGASVSVLVGDVDAEVERLTKAGVPIASMPDDSLDGRSRTASVRDPEGRIVELREPLSGRTGEAP